VNLIEPGVKDRHVIANDKEGRFRFVRLQKKAYDLTVQVWDPPKDAPPVEAREVWPDTGEVAIVAAFDAPKKQKPGSVRGTIADAGGRLNKPLHLILSTGRSWRTQDNVDGMSFHFDDVEPGVLQLIAMSGDDPVLYGAKFELHEAEQKDIGTLVTEPGGKLLLHIVRSPGTESLQPKLWLTPVGGSHGRNLVLPSGVADVPIDNLCVGEYRLYAYEKGMLQVEARCTVTVQATAETTIELRPAIEREIVVEYDAAQKIKHVHVQGARGEAVFDYEGRYVQARPFHTRPQFPIGRFTLRVETEAGGVAETTFEMTSLDANQPAVVVRAK
jgi:hypothetical protein